MQVKTFEAISIKDAIKAVKTEFGQDAVILRTKEKTIENQKFYEVTAAAADRPRSLGASANANMEADLLFSGQKANEERLESLELKLSTLSEQVAKKSQLTSIESGLEEIKMMVLEYLRNKEDSPYRDLPESLLNVHRQLKLMGVEDMQISQLMQHLQELPPVEQQKGKLPEDSSDYYRSNAIRWMLKRIQLSTKWQSAKGSIKLHAFVGPSGSGKTSMVAKLAANYSKQHQSKVLLVSFDNQRLTASEQLRVYAKILGIAFETIDSAEELEKALDKHRDAEMVFIDTAGRSPKSSPKIKDLQSLSKLSIPIEFHLVLSVAEKPQQLDRCVRSFSSIGINSLCFSKLDESWSYGEIFNLSVKWSLPLSYFSIGQKIPEDLEKASRERVVERIFSL